MHPHLRLHIPIQTQAHIQNIQTQQELLVFFKTCTDLYIIKFASNILTIVVFLFKIS